MVFEKKIRDEDAWKLYKRAYKKYYARVMKGRMDKGELLDVFLCHVLHYYL